MAFAIIHTATRVIKVFTVDANRVLASDESSVAITEPATLPTSASGFYKLDATNNVVAATINEANEAGVNEVFNEQQAKNRLLALRDAAIAMRDDATVPVTSSDFARKLVQYLHISQ